MSGRPLSEREGQCEAMVWMRPGYWHKFQCKRKATDEVSGCPLCTQHANLARKKGLTYVL